MSDEDEEKVHRTLDWRNDEVTDLLHRCDAALGIVRKYGEPSTRAPNIHCLELIKPEIDLSEI